MLIIGTPNGDAVLNTTLARKEGKLAGTVIPKGSDQKEEIKISNIEEAEGKVTLYFTIQEYDVHVLLEKVDDDNLKGSLMNMFDVKAKRIKE
jgi:23S rRNA maturation-related 3'-5' exoribonuclease YhaM